MLKCIHKTPVFSEKLIKFSTDFHRHYLLFGENKAHLYDVDGNALSQFECKGGMREGVFADNMAIVATDEGTLNFYNIKERTSKIVKRSVHGLLPGPGFASFYIVTHRGRGLDLALIGSTEKNPVLRMDGVSSIFSGLKRFFTGVIEPSELSISHSKSKSYICNKTNKAFIYCGSKLDETLGSFPLPIYKVVETPLGDIYLGVKENIVRGFFEDMRERFTNEFPFYVKEVLATDKNIIVVCSYGTIFVLNLVGDITDGGFIGKEIIDCHISSDGFLWCLLEDGSLMIITLDPQENPEISQLIDLSIRENRTPLQEALLKEVELQSELRKLSRKTKELNVFESKLKMESKKLATLSSKVKKREKSAEAKLKDAEKLEAEMPKLDNVEALSIRLKELEQKAAQDKTQLAAREAEIDKITQEIKITEELIEDSLYPDIPTEMKSLTKELGASADETLAILVWDMLNNGTSTTNHTGADALALFSGSHTYIDGSTWSNLLSPAADLSATALQTAIDNFEQLKDESGRYQVLKAKSIIVNPANAWKAKELLNSAYDPESANNAVNTIKERNLQLVVSPYYTDTDGFTLMAEPENEMSGIIAYNRRKITFAQDGDFETGDSRFKASFRFSVECAKPSNLYLSAGA